MGRRCTERQLSFESELEPNAPLDLRVVLIDDPRWSSSLVEATLSKFAGLDCEFYSDSEDSGGDGDEDWESVGGDGDEKRSGGIDPYTTSLRLVQLALPSGRCLVADFGGVGDDRAALRRLYGDDGEVDHVVIDGFAVEVLRFRRGSFLAVLRDLCESRSVKKILHHAKIDALMLRVHFGIRCRNLRCTMVLSQHYWAGIRGCRHGLGFLSARAVAASAPGVWLVEKRLQQSEWRWKLSTVQLNYAALDAIVVLTICRWLMGLCVADGTWESASAEMGAIVGFLECEAEGMPLSPALVDDHLEYWRRGRDHAVKPFLARYPGVDPAKNREVAVAMTDDDCYGGHRFYELDETKTSRRPYFVLGKRFDRPMRKQEMRGVEKSPHSVAEHVLVRFSHLPWIDALMDWRSMGIIEKWLMGVKRRMRQDGRVRGEYSQIAGGEKRGGADTGLGRGLGRSSCTNPPLQVAANPQPKISRILAEANGWSKEFAKSRGFDKMSPRLPFVPHDEVAAAYMRAAARRLRDAAASTHGKALDIAVAASRPRTWGDPAWGDGETAESDSGAVGGVAESGMPQPLTPERAEARAKWFEHLAARWEADPRCFVVADFSQAHMRIAAEASKDPQLCEDFRLDRDAHLKLAYDFGTATGQIDGGRVCFDEFASWYVKGHRRYDFAKELRKPAKTGNYTCLNMGSTTRLKEAGDTAPEPVTLSLEGWDIIRSKWRERYHVLLAYQRSWVRECNDRDVVIDGKHYGVAWSLRRGRRLFQEKWPDKYSRMEPRLCRGCGAVHGGLTVKGTDSVSMRWLGSEADAHKWAKDRIVEEFDRHDAYFMARKLVPISSVWDAKLGNSCHDEVDCDGRKRYALQIAACVRKWFAEGLRWCGLDVIPAEAADAKDSDLIVKCWAEK